MNIEFKYKPTNIEEIIGNELPKAIIKSIVNKSNEVSHIIIMHGNKGSGKTILSKLLAKELGIQYEEIYTYYSSPIERIKKYIEESLMDRYVYAINEFDKLSLEQQYELIEPLSEYDANKYYILSIEDIDKINNQLLNRAIVIDMEPISDRQIEEKVREILQKENRQIIEEDIKIIVRRSENNIYKAYKLLDKYLILERNVFLEYTESIRLSLLKLLLTAILNDKDKAEGNIYKILTRPNSYVKMDYENLILEIMKVKTKVIEPKDEYISKLIELLQSKVYDLFDILNDKELYDMFDNEVKLQTALWYIFVRVRELTNNNI